MFPVLKEQSVNVQVNKQGKHKRILFPILSYSVLDLSCPVSSLVFTGARRTEHYLNKSEMGTLSKRKQHKTDPCKYKFNCLKSPLYLGHLQRCVKC